MNDTELQEVAALSAENEDLKKRLRISLDNQSEIIAERESYKNSLASTLADKAAAEHSRDTFKTGFETQQRAHDDAIKIIQKLQAQNKSLSAQIAAEKSDGPATIQ